MIRLVPGSDLVARPAGVQDTLLTATSLSLLIFFIFATNRCCSNMISEGRSTVHQGGQVFLYKTHLNLNRKGPWSPPGVWPPKKTKPQTQNISELGSRASKAAVKNPGAGNSASASLCPRSQLTSAPWGPQTTRTQWELRLCTGGPVAQSSSAMLPG